VVPEWYQHIHSCNFLKRMQNRNNGGDSTSRSVLSAGEWNHGAQRTNVDTPGSSNMNSRAISASNSGPRWTSSSDPRRAGTSNMDSRAPVKAHGFPCIFCSTPCSPANLQSHYHQLHIDLSYRCGICPSQERRCYAILSVAESHLKQIHPHIVGGRKSGQLLLPGSIKFANHGVINYGAWAALKCKSTKCNFTGIGLDEAGKDHLEKCHPGEGVENLNIFCRVCEQNIEKSVHNFDDEEELQEHIEMKHRDQIEIIKKAKLQLL